MVIIERSKEYDAFGPWIYEIDEEHEIPKVFRDCYSEREEPLILFKVPRNIDRRDANAHMDLYDYLVGAYGQYLHIYKRAGKRVTDQRIYYNEISAVRDIHALLKGVLILFAQDAPAVIEYNTVSEEVVRKLINIIEGKICADGQSIRMESIPAEYSADESTIDILFFNLFNKLQTTDPALSLIAFQPAMRLQNTRGLKKRLNEEKLRLSKTAFITNETELIVLERDMTFGKRKGEHEYSYLYIPFQSITGARLRELDAGRYLYILELKVKKLVFSYIIERGNKRIFDLYHKLYNFNRIA